MTRVIVSAAAVAAVVMATTTPARAGGKGEVAPLTAAGLPNVQAAAAAVLDARTGELLFAKAPDDVRPIASTTKIFVAMVVRRKGIDLDGVTEINREDARYARGGSRTHLDIRNRFSNLDLLRAMLIASDNRAPTALGRAAGLTPEQLVAAMNDLAAQLGLKKTRFTDPSGLNGNDSTAREMVLALREAMKDPLLAEIMSTAEVDVTSIRKKPIRFHFRNTNHALHAGRYKVTAGKTGFTDEAGYCLIIGARIGGRDLVMAFLGAKGKLTRFADFDRVAAWLARQSSASAAEPASPPPPR